MQGASALQVVLEELEDPPVQVLVVWEPVLWTDVGPPVSSVLARLSSPRALQFWDGQRALSKFMVEAAVSDPSLLQPGDALPQDGIVWDFVAIFPPRAVWKGLPRPTWYGGPVVDVIDQVRSTLSAMPR